MLALYCSTLKNVPTILSSGIVDVTFGENVTVVQPLNLYGCTLGHDCFVGPFTEIQRGVRIGHHTRIQSHSFICEGVSIGSHCFVGHGVTFINDTFASGQPAGGNRELWKNTHIADHVSIGSHATILPVSICSHVVIGAGSVVTKNIVHPGIYAGNPARLIKPLNKDEQQVQP